MFVRRARVKFLVALTVVASARLSAAVGIHDLGWEVVFLRK